MRPITIYSAVHIHTDGRLQRGQADLCIELDVGGAEADEASEEGLVQVAVLLEGHVLDHRGQLVVVPYQDHTLQPAVPILLPLNPYKNTLQR